jgi:hypothetical protein
MFFTSAEKYRTFADSIAPIPQLSWWGVMYQRFSFFQIGRGWIEHELIYAPCSP